MGRNSRARRTPLQGRADRSAQEVSAKLGRMLKDGRARLRLTQQQASGAAGISRGRWSDLETGRDALATLATWSRASTAVGGSLEAWIRQTSAADQPRDAVHLRNQELVIRSSRGGGWKAIPEELIDSDARSSRAADVLLSRTSRIDGIDEFALCDVWDWFDDVGAIVRDFTRRVSAVERYAIARMRGSDASLPRVGACWVVRATARNRRLLAEHRHFFQARFPGAASAWLKALTTAGAPMPAQPAVLWVSVMGDRLFPARLS